MIIVWLSAGSLLNFDPCGLHAKKFGLYIAQQHTQS